MRFLHTCLRGASSCARCRACDATRTRRPAAGPDGQPYLVRLCAHCDGPAAVALAKRRTS